MFIHRSLFDLAQLNAYLRKALPHHQWCEPLCITKAGDAALIKHLSADDFHAFTPYLPLKLMQRRVGETKPYDNDVISINKPKQFLQFQRYFPDAASDALMLVPVEKAVVNNRSFSLWCDKQAAAPLLRVTGRYEVDGQTQFWTQRIDDALMLFCQQLIDRLLPVIESRFIRVDVDVCPLGALVVNVGEFEGFEPVLTEHFAAFKIPEIYALNQPLWQQLQSELAELNSLLDAINSALSSAAAMAYKSSENHQYIAAAFQRILRNAAFAELNFKLALIQSADDSALLSITWQIKPTLHGALDVNSSPSAINLDDSVIAEAAVCLLGEIFACVEAQASSL